MTRLLCAFCVLYLCGFAVGQTRAEEPRDVPRTIKIQPKLENLSEEQKAAVELATEYLKKQKSNWGNPTKIRHHPEGANSIVGKGKAVYTIYYPTPEREIPLVGERGVQVNVETKQVRFLPRR